MYFIPECYTLYRNVKWANLAVRFMNLSGWEKRKECGYIKGWYCVKITKPGVRHLEMKSSNCVSMCKTFNLPGLNFLICKITEIKEKTGEPFQDGTFHESKPLKETASKLKLYRQMARFAMSRK